MAPVRVQRANVHGADKQVAAHVRRRRRAVRMLDRRGKDKDRAVLVRHRGARHQAQVARLRGPPALELQVLHLGWARGVGQYAEAERGGKAEEGGAGADIVSR